MGFGWPLALFGLAALAVPLAVHLLQRGHHRTVEIATTQFVPEQARPQWRWTQLREPWLWLLRTLLVLCGVLLIAEPYRQVTPVNTDAPPITLVSTRVAAQTARDLAGADATLRWLAPGWPALDEAAPAWQPGQFFGLLWHADQTLPATTPLRVIAPTLGSETGARRPALSRAVTWLSAPAATTPMPARTVHIVYDAERQRDAEALRTVVAAWRDAGVNVSARLSTPEAVPSEASRVVWLSATPWTARLDRRRSGIVVSDAPAPDDSFVLQVDARGQPQAQQHRDGARIVRHLTTPLRAAEPRVGDTSFAVELAALLLFAPTTADLPELPLASTLTNSNTAVADDAPPRRSLNAIFVLAIVTLAALERAASGWIPRP